MTDQPELPEIDIQRELRALLAEVAPSPAFAAGVRARIAADEAKRSRAWLAWAIPAAAVVTVGVGAWLFVPRLITPALPGATQSVTFTPGASAPAQVAVNVPAASHASAPRIVAREPRTPAPHPASREFEVLVPDDQMTALVHYLDRLNEGITPTATTFGPTYDADGLLVAPVPLVITPLPLLGAPPDDNTTTKPDGKGSGKDQR